MERYVDCKKLKKKLLGLEVQPFPGELGERIYNQISQEAWDSWLEYQTKFINEFRMNMMEDEAREYVLEMMQSYLFSEDKKNSSEAKKDLDS
jgi:Fe-S cluster biosynthesis and repair protein YggX